MIIRMLPAGPAVVEDADVLTSLSVVRPVDHARDDDLIASGDDGHVWVVVDELRRRAQGDRGAGWGEDFGRMVDYARSAGWVSEDGRLVRAHVEPVAP